MTGICCDSTGLQYWIKEQLIRHGLDPQDADVSELVIDGAGKARGLRLNTCDAFVTYIDGKEWLNTYNFNCVTMDRKLILEDILFTRRGFQLVGY